MTTIKITPQSLIYDCQKFSNAASEISRINNDIAHIVSSLDWEIRGKGNVESLIDRAAAEGRNLAIGAESLSQYLKTAANLFQEADAKGNTAIGETTCKLMPSTATTIPGIAVAGGVLAGMFAFSLGSQRIGTNLDWIKRVIGVGTTNNNSASQNSAQNVAVNNAGVTATKTEVISGFKSKFKNFIKKHPEGGVYQGEGECKGFARLFYKDGFGTSISLPPTNQKTEYELNVAPSSEVKEVGQIVSSGSVNGEDVKNLFVNAKPGDMVQMKWEYSKKLGSGPHSAIFMGIENGKIEFYDANMDLNNGIQIHSYTFEEYAKKINEAGNGVTIYTPTL